MDLHPDGLNRRLGRQTLTLILAKMTDSGAKTQLCHSLCNPVKLLHSSHNSDSSEGKSVSRQAVRSA